jgi:hypothetical protein
MTTQKFEELLDAFENAVTDLDSEPCLSTSYRGYAKTKRAAYDALLAHVEALRAQRDAAIEYLEAWERTNPEPNWRRGDLVAILSGTPQRTGQLHD